jgi:hypothetical protein
MSIDFSTTHAIETVIGNLDAVTRKQMGNSCHGYTVFEINEDALDAHEYEVACLEADGVIETGLSVAQARADALADIIGVDACEGDEPAILVALEAHPYTNA